MGMRRIGSAERTRKRAKTRARNRPRKARERAARDARMLEVLRGGGGLPYTPWVMSWLSDRLDKRSKAITQADVEGVLTVAEARAST